MSDPNAVRFSPSADRNHQLIGQVLAPLLPDSGRALEIASGTGQHVIHFAQLQPALNWQPSDPDADSRASVAARIDQSDLPNIQLPIDLDVHQQPWPVHDLALIVCINMIHISPFSAAQALIAGAADALQAGGQLFLYGPFLQDGVPTAPGNIEFDQSLRSRNPDWGIRELEAITGLAEQVGFGAPTVHPMPANNLSVIFELSVNRP